jgi:hypothetical protein
MNNINIDTRFSNGVTLSNQITDILSKYASPSAANPEKIYTVLGNEIACHSLLTQATSEELGTVFRQTLTLMLSDDDMEEVLPKWSFQTGDISFNAEYDEEAAARDLMKFCNQYIGNVGKERLKVVEMLHGLILAVASLLYGIYSDDDGIVSDEIIDEHVEFVERSVLSNIEAVERYCNPS